ncbi:MAG: hypothetical protein M3Q07_26245 [Pseudobdellovibrionaceae bacterium]|nr:hypothetical protein [Pseudobdellovibrionaceae bacterium]
MKHILIILAGVALIYVLFLKPKKLVTSVPAYQQPKKLAARASQEPTLQAPTQPSRVSQQEAVESVKASGLARQSGFRSLPFKKVDGYWELPLQFVSTLKHCEMGDLDLIRIDQKRRDINSLILVLDDMTSQKNIFYKKLDPASLANLSLTVRWKASDETRPIGLYICSDVKDSRSCVTASVTDVNRPLERAKPPQNNDNVYYFQFLQEASQISLLDASRSQSKNPKTLGQVFKDEGMGTQAATKLAENVARTHLEVGSMAARMERESKKLIIDLPQNDPACPLPQLKF